MTDFVKRLRKAAKFGGHYAEAATEIKRLQAQNELLEELVATQAADEGLWFIAETAPEAYLQASLRKLHEAVEGKSSEQCALAAFKEQT